MADQNSEEYKKFSELDFDLIKDSLKTHLKSQDKFKDYDFEGAGLTILTNLLSYNTQYNSYYLNMMASERFRSTSQKRESAAGHANNVGYIPASRNSATAYINADIFVDSGYTGNIVLPKNLKFSATIDGIDYQFLSTTTTTVVPSSGKYSITDFEIKEGRFFAHRFIVSSSDKYYVIPNAGLDISRLKVYVKESESSISQVEYSLSDDINEIDSTSTIFFIEEHVGGKHRIYFGDGIIGKKPSVGNQIVVEYYICAGEDANGIKKFSLDDDVSGLSTLTITNSPSSSGGANEESIESIKRVSPLAYSSQNRAVSDPDWEFIIRKIYPATKVVSAIGGEKYTPRQYGRVMISILRNDGSQVTLQEKNNIIKELDKRYSIKCIIPVIVDAIPIHLKIDIVPDYDPQVSSKSTVITSINNAIMDYYESSLVDFDITFRKSRFTTIIDNSDLAIKSNATTITPYISTLTSNIVINGVKFRQAIKPKSLYTNSITYGDYTNVILKDVDGLGFLSLYNPTLSGLVLLQSNIAKINYTTGEVSFLIKTSQLQSIIEQNSQGIKFYVNMVSDDITVVENYYFKIESSDINIL